MIVHWSDWSQQPEIRIACTQSYHYVLASNSSQKDIFDTDSYCYTFNTKLVNCDKCLELESFKESHQSVLDFEQEVQKSGLTEEEYVQRLIKCMTSDQS